MFIDDEKGIYLEWANDHKISYSEDNGIGQGKNICKNPKNMVIMGINVKINIFKRQQYCMEKGIDENFQAPPTTSQKISTIPIDVELNIKYAENVPSSVLQQGEAGRPREGSRIWSKRSSIFGNVALPKSIKNNLLKRESIVIDIETLNEIANN